jgi:hypothetical protein
VAVKNDEQYEALKDKGMSKERAARIANSPKASAHGGERSDSGPGKALAGQLRYTGRPAEREVKPRPESPDLERGPEGLDRSSRTSTFTPAIAAGCLNRTTQRGRARRSRVFVRG